MRYQKSLAIEQRLEMALRLIQSGEYSTPALAEKVAVSIPTVSRIVAALRQRGHNIRAERHEKNGWRYVLVPKKRDLKFRPPQFQHGEPVNDSAPEYR